MMRKARGRARGARGDGLLPTPERLAQGPIEPLGYPIIDSCGDYARPLRGLDTLACMEREGTIGRRERQAGDRFHDLFRRASFDNLFSADPTRIPVVLMNGNARCCDGACKGNDAARLAVLSALDALGGIHSPGGSVAWHVLGLETSLAQWSLVGWSGHRVPRLAASGILLADLGILRGHFAC